MKITKTNARHSKKCNAGHRTELVSQGRGHLARLTYKNSEPVLTTRLMIGGVDVWMTQAELAELIERARYVQNEGIKIA